MTKKYQELRARINKHCPYLMELRKGCQFEWCNEAMEQVVYEIAWIVGTENILTGKQGFSLYAFTVGVGKNNDPYPKWHSFDNPEDYEEDGATFFDYATILGIPPTLQDVLMAIEKNKKHFCVLETGEVRPWYKHTSASDEMGCWLDEEYTYDRTKPLSEQDEDVIDFLLSVIK